MSERFRGRTDPSPIIVLNGAIAVAEIDGAQVALAALDPLGDKLASYHATQADLLRRLGRSDESRAAYGKAIERAGNTAEIAYLIRRREKYFPSGVLLAASRPS